MIKYAIFAACFLWSPCECAARTNTKEGWTAEREGKIRDVRKALNLRDCVCSKFPSDERFFVTVEEDLFHLSSPGLLPYDGISVRVHIPPPTPNSSYVLYCPLSGCPVQPEVIEAFLTDEEANLVPEEMFKELKENHITLSLKDGLYVSLFANPGYCSDWYLLCSNPFHILHTTFTYKPIVSRDEQGRTLTIQKLEPGGNCLGIILQGFKPGQKVTMTSNSAGEILQNEREIEKDGMLSFLLFPQVVGKTKGNILVRFSYEGGALEAASEWDMAVLDIPRAGPPSDLWNHLSEGPPR